MEHRELVKVYSFRVFDEGNRDWRIAPHKAPRDVVVERFGGEVLEGTAHEVAPDELDGQGRYRRLATGWGDLA